jgi:hypothetical protein
VTFEEIPLSNNFVIKVSLKAYVIDVKYEKAFLSDVTARGSRILSDNNITRPIHNIKSMEVTE